MDSPICTVIFRPQQKSTNFMSKIAHSPRPHLRLKRSGVQAKLWPNGEISFHLPKRMKEPPASPSRPLENRSIWAWWVAARGLGSAVQQALLMGLSNVANFDKARRPAATCGLKGITSLGKRRVRNACYMLTREAGKRRLTFATVTVPDLSNEDMMTIHLNWHKVIDRYRLLMTRHLIAGGNSGELVGVSEVQEKRYAKNGFPVLHAHFVFVGAAGNGAWLVSPSRHDYIWRKSLESALGKPVLSVASACQLKQVKGSAEGYLGKYMSKGGKAIADIVADGFEWALPKQWWNCSRSIVGRMKKEMRRFNEGTAWLIDQAIAKNTDIWAFYSVVTIEMPDGELVDVGSYGRLTPAANGKVRDFLGLRESNRTKI